MQPKKTNWWHEEPDVPNMKLEPRSIQVAEDAKDNWTGLYDQYGNAIYSAPIKFGFRR